MILPYAQVKRNEVNVYNVKKKTLTFLKSLTQSLSNFGDGLCQKRQMMLGLSSGKMK